MAPDNKLTSYAMATVLFANAFLFPVVFIYIGNVDYFASPFTQFLRLFAGLFAVVLLVIMLLSIICGRRQRQAVNLTVAALSILFWVQSTFLVWELGPLDGSTIDWQQYQFQLWVDVLVWVVGIGLALLLIWKNKPSWLIRCAMLVFAVQAISATIGLLTLPITPERGQRHASESSLRSVVNFSKQQNVLHILIDAYQADAFEELINEPELEESYNQSFEGFVYFRETLGVFPRTKYSVPASLSGQAYDNKVGQGYIEAVMNGATILSAAKDNRFEIDIVAEGNARFVQYSEWPHNNIFDLNDLQTSEKGLQEFALLVDLALFRILPGGFKIFIYNSQQWRVSRVIMFDTEYLLYEYFSSALFVDYLTDSMTTERETPVYKFLHLMNTHGPLAVTPDCGYAGAVYPFSREAYTFTAKCTLDLLVTLFAKMKQLGIYDNTLIVLQADHGGWVPNFRQPANQDKIGYQLSAEGPVTYLPFTIRAAASPLLAVKPPGAKGPVDTRNTLASLLDIPDTISEAMQWSDRFGNWPLLSTPETKQRRRYFRYYNREKNAGESDFTGPLVEYGISGSHYESDWKIDRILLPGNTH